MTSTTAHHGDHTHHNHEMDSGKVTWTQVNNELDSFAKDTSTISSTIGHHSSSAANKSARCKLLFMLSLTTLFFLIEITVGYITNSMALVADSFHMLSDVIALVIAYVSVRMSPKRWSKNTFGWARAEVLGALVNAVFLCALCFSILVESVKRFCNPEEIHDPQLILVVGVSGLIVNVIGLFLFKDGGGGHGHSHGGGGHGHSHGGGGGGGGHGHSHGGGGGHGHSHGSSGHQHLPSEGLSISSSDAATPSPEPGSDKNGSAAAAAAASAQQMNMRGVFLHVLADALGSVIVCASAMVYLYTDFKYKDFVDPTLSVLMVCLILYSTWGLLIESAMILLQTVPTHIQVDSLQRKLLQEIDGVLAVHEFHVWQLAGDRIIASAHIRCHNLQEYMAIAEKVKEFFHNEGIHSTTIQPEFIDMDEFKLPENDDCVLECPKKTTGNCVPQTCCGPQQNGGKESPKLMQVTSGKENGHQSSNSSSKNNSPSLNKRSNTLSLNPGGINSVSDSNLRNAGTEFVEIVTSSSNVNQSSPSVTTTTGHSHSHPHSHSHHHSDSSSSSRTNEQMV